ncbi:MAG: hypothetical protein JW732_02965 [Dehalococcoidia bacterium]|nr:hypothetical protein [Dehalococcoidia bacterium]
MPKGYFVCYSCGKRAELSTEERPCEVLSGWLTVSHWKGPGAVEHYNFCSFTCLKTWADAQAPKIPEAFLRAFEEEKDE